MLSFAFRRVLSRPGIFSIAQRLPTRAISSNQSFTTTVQRNLATTARDRSSDSTADSKPKPQSKPKSTRRETGSSPKTVGKDKKKIKEKEKAVKKPKKVTIDPEDFPPKPPGPSYSQWLRDWIPTQPKIENAEGAKMTISRGAQVWNALPEYEKQPYREKHRVLMDEYHKRIEEWRENIDPAVRRELNRRRVAKGLSRYRGPHRPLSGYVRFFMRVQNEYPRTEGDYQTRFKAIAGLVSSQWRAMSDAEKAVYNDPAKADIAAWHEKYKVGVQAKA